MTAPPTRDSPADGGVDAASAEAAPVDDLGSFHPVIGRFDQAVDAWFDHLRGRALADRGFYTLSALADYSALWLTVGAVRALKGDQELRQAVRLSAVLGVEQALVNGPVKSLFNRSRPVQEHVRPHRLRTPLTTSFPSGHASAAFCAAALLSDGSRLAPAWYGLAGLVAASRIHVRIHHASDVLAGAAIGLTLGQLARRLWRT